MTKNQLLEEIKESGGIILETTLKTFFGLLILCVIGFTVFLMLGGLDFLGDMAVDIHAIFLTDEPLINGDKMTCLELLDGLENSVFVTDVVSNLKYLELNDC